mmetsp:Transcript_65444/g.136342  ORF Transcript_65444/g.136342 Transcript_65444/m.136342 type:complete len:118 (+) Transcript_65444:546-899(+)
MWSRPPRRSGRILVAISCLHSVARCYESFLSRMHSDICVRQAKRSARMRLVGSLMCSPAALTEHLAIRVSAYTDGMRWLQGLKTQIFSVTGIDVDEIVVTGIGAGVLDDSADLVALG